jgi:hypothetical protein
MESKIAIDFDVIIDSKSSWYKQLVDIFWINV